MPRLPAFSPALVMCSFGIAAGQTTVPAPDPVPVSFPTADGGVVHASEYGSAPRAVILAHGGRFTKESWAEQVPALVDAGFRVVAIDFRGRGQSRGGPGLETAQDSVHLDVLAAVAYLRGSGAETISLVGGSFGGWASARAVTRLPRGSVEALVLLAAAPIENPEQLHGRLLFVVTEGDASGGGRLRLPGIRDQYARAAEPKELLVLPGSAHAQFIFETDRGPDLLRTTVRFLEGSR